MSPHGWGKSRGVGGVVWCAWTEDGANVSSITAGTIRPLLGGPGDHTRLERPASIATTLHPLLKGGTQKLLHPPACICLCLHKKGSAIGVGVGGGMGGGGGWSLRKIRGT